MILPRRSLNRKYSSVWCLSNVKSRPNSRCHRDDVFGDSPFSIGSGEEVYTHAGGGSGGYLEHIAEHAAQELFGYKLEKVTYKTLR